VGGVLRDENKMQNISNTLLLAMVRRSLAVIICNTTPESQRSSMNLASYPLTQQMRIPVAVAVPPAVVFGAAAD
jgi:hypothetical protein